MDDIRLVVASNIIRLRTQANLTQAQLGEKLNYSDKTISKWERAEALPDVSVLKQIGEIFHVSLDELINAHNQWARPLDKKRDKPEHRFSRTAVTLVTLAGIWTLAVIIFVIFWILGSWKWKVFVYAVPVSLVTLLLFNSFWNKGKGNLYIVSALVLSLIASLYVGLLRYQLWQLFIIAAPAEVVVYLSFRIRIRIRDHNL